MMSEIRVFGMDSVGRASGSQDKNRIEKSMNSEKDGSHTDNTKEVVDFNDRSIPEEALARELPAGLFDIVMDHLDLEGSEESTPVTDGGTRKEGSGDFGDEIEVLADHFGMTPGEVMELLDSASGDGDSEMDKSGDLSMVESIFDYPGSKTETSPEDESYPVWKEEDGPDVGGGMPVLENFYQKQGEL
jgi:hypothetical protein